MVETDSGETSQQGTNRKSSSSNSLTTFRRGQIFFLLRHLVEKVAVRNKVIQPVELKVIRPASRARRSRISLLSCCFSAICSRNSNSSK